MVAISDCNGWFMDQQPQSNHKDTCSPMKHDGWCATTYKDVAHTYMAHCE